MKPYVYKLTHKVDGTYYYGSRTANKVKSTDDLGVKYFSSNKTIKSSFENYIIQIVMECDSNDEAFLLEQSLIKAAWNDDLLINKHYQKTRTSFSMKGFKRPDVAEHNSKTKKKPREIRTYECVHCHTFVDKEEPCHMPHKLEFVCSRKCNGAYQGKKSGHKLKGVPNLALKGQPSWNKGLSNANAAVNGKKSADKVSKTVTGRKMINHNGARTWAYPEDGKWFIKTTEGKIYLPSEVTVG